MSDSFGVSFVTAVLIYYCWTLFVFFFKGFREIRAISRTSALSPVSIRIACPYTGTLDLIETSVLAEAVT